MLAAIPLMIIPFIAYNVIIAGFGGAALGNLTTTLVEVPMMSGAVWSMSIGDLMVVVALILLFVEILKATRTGSWSVMDHLLSTFVFVAYLVEFLLVANAATDIFFILMAIAFIDVIAGFSVSIRSAGRDVSIGL